MSHDHDEYTRLDQLRRALELESSADTAHYFALKKAREASKHTGDLATTAAQVWAEKAEDALDIAIAARCTIGHLDRTRRTNWNPR